MRIFGQRTSGNVEDRRGSSGQRGGVIGGGIGGVVLLILGLVFGLNPSIFNSSQGYVVTEPQSSYVETSQEQERSHFVSVVLASTEDVWTDIFKAEGINYEYPKLVLFTGYVDSACGTSSAATGPFYCPPDQKVYIDLSFYDELAQRFQSPGDFAMAYVIAHEVGHHVQNLLGIEAKYEEAVQGMSEEEANQYSVRLELQADYFAGVWAHHVQGMGLLEQGDLEEALNAATQIGDDRIQQNTQGYVMPDTFTHGTSEQRKNWFYKGYVSGTIEGGDTFSAGTL
jgi:uncharacterized protein